MKAREDFMDSTENSGEFKYHEYMRAYYAGCALTGIMACPVDDLPKEVTYPDGIARYAIELSDHLIAELNRK